VSPRSQEFIEQARDRQEAERYVAGAGDSITADERMLDAD
jgi:hypothetical protein